MNRTDYRSTPALYDGRRVFVNEPRHVTGGRVVDLRRDPAETDWPWTVQEWTCNADHVSPR